MDNKRKGLLILIGSLLILTIGLTYAYYSAMVQGTGNANAEASATTATLGEVEFNGENTFDTTNVGRDIYPGFIGVQTFTIAPYADGHGIYEIDLEANVPAAFGSDIKITLYKTSDATNNNIESEEGSLTITNNQYVKQDTLTVTGTLTKVYEGRLTDTDEEILEQVEFLIENDEFTTPDTTPDDYYTYYVVYEYLDNGNQNNQQGLDFDAKITVKYVVELNNPARDTLEELQALNSALTVTPSTSINPNFARIAPKSSAGQSYTGMPVNGDYYITYASDFTYDETTGVYTLTNPTTCQWSTCYADTNGKYAVPGSEGVGQSDSTPVTESSSENMNNAMIQITSPTASGADVTLYQGDELNNVKTGAWSPQTSGVFELDDDYGTSYYYRGDVNDNYVKFAGYYWRIIRINGDGTIRMIYAGDASIIGGLANKLEVLANGYDDSSTQYTQIGTSKFNESYNDNAYVGYMYGTPRSDNYNDTHANTNSSTIKTYLDTWYENNIKNTENEAYVADAIFCNDRSVGSDEAIEYATNNYGTTFGKLGYHNATLYGAESRLIEEIGLGKGNKATLKCPNKDDAFTVSDTMHGNGALTYPVGLLTIDEANIAGGAWEKNYNYYLTTGNWYWTGSPSGFDYGSAGVRSVYYFGVLSDADVPNTHGVRPVLSLKSGSLTSGSGTAADPYLVG